MGIFGITTQTSPSCFNVHSENTFHAKQIVFRFFHSCHIPSMEQLTTISKNCPITQSIQNQTSNSKTRSTTIPEHESTKYFIAACVLGAAHLIMTFIEKNIIHSPLCTCGQIETQAHYLLHCPNNIVQRHQYYRNLHNDCQQFTIWKRQITSRHKCPNWHELT